MTPNTDLLQYSKSFVDTLLSKYKEDDIISGNEILEFSSIKPYNLIIIQNLLIQWKIELNTMRSPYFNYDHPEVQNALKKFGNVLSRHISVHVSEFRQLAERSAFETILLFGSPYEYFNNLVKREEFQKLSLEEFRQTAKYVKINHHVLDSFLQLLESESRPSVFGANDMLEKVFENLTEPPADPEPYIKEFSKVVPLESSIIFPDPEQTKKDTESTSGEVYAQTVSATEVIDVSIPYDDDPNYKGSLNEKFSDTNKKTLADLHQSQKIDNIRSTITLNQRFMFIRHLFNENESQFNETIDTLESMNTLTEAKGYLEQNYTWDFSSEEVIEFMGIIEKRHD